MTNLTRKSYIGIDISKAKLDVCLGKRNDVKTVDNTVKGCKELFKILKKFENVPSRLSFQPEPE